MRVVRVSAGALSALLLLSAVGSALLSYEAADRLIHPPREHTRATPDWRGLDFERVRFDSEDGLALLGWWMPASDPIGTVIFLHGYGASKSQALSVAPFLVRSSFNVLAFDFRAHGESEGGHTSVGLDEAKDVLGAVAYLRGRGDVDMQRIALFGWSMGAAAALNAADQLPQIRAVVADSSFARLSDVVAQNLDSFTGLPRFPFVPLIVFFASHMTGHGPGDNAPAERVAVLHRPILVIQGEDDGIAREEQGVQLAAAAGEWADLWIVPRAGHVDARRADPREYEDRVVSFLEAALR